MNAVIDNQNLLIPEDDIIIEGNCSPFIVANTKPVSLEHLRNDCTIPVFSKDNEITIPHHKFIECVRSSVTKIYSESAVSRPKIRCSHIVKGRVPSAIGKPVKELLESERTIYYERMAFQIDVPEIKANIGGNKLNLSIGGVRSLNQENLYGRKHLEKFKIYIGFKNNVCTNMCVTSDGSVSNIRVSNTEELTKHIMHTIGAYQMQTHLNLLKELPNYNISEEEFAQFIGKCRLYNHLPKKDKMNIPELLLNDSQTNSVARGYYEDDEFCRKENGSINLWSFYNLLTGSNKSSYIDSFLERGVNAHQIAQNTLKSLKNDVPF